MVDVNKMIDELRTSNRDFKNAESIVAALHKVGGLLERMRKRAHLNQSELGERLDLTAGRVSQLESGALRDTPSLKTLLRYAQACGESIDIMASGERPSAEAAERAADQSATAAVELAALHKEMAALRTAVEAAQLKPNVAAAKLAAEVAALRAEIGELRAVISVTLRKCERAWSEEPIPVMARPAPFATVHAARSAAEGLAWPDPEPYIKYGIDPLAAHRTYHDLPLDGAALAMQSYLTGIGFGRCHIQVTEPKITDNEAKVTFTVKRG